VNIPPISDSMKYKHPQGSNIKIQEHHHEEERSEVPRPSAYPITDYRSEMGMKLDSSF